MFRRLSEPLALSEASLLALRPALNAPVLNTEFLPVGPARAAIVVFAEEYGDIGVAIGVRSNEGGQVVVFRTQEPLDAQTKIVDALEPALASAERMGFLFDEDIVNGPTGSHGRAEAMALWGRLMGEIETPTPAKIIASQPATSESILDHASRLPRSAGQPAEVEVPELLLDDVAPIEPVEISLDMEDELKPVVIETATPIEPPTPPAPQLSRFRQSAESVTGSAAALQAPDNPTPSQNNDAPALGRIPIVRIRRRAPKRVPYLARLLSSF